MTAHRMVGGLPRGDEHGIRVVLKEGHGIFRRGRRKKGDPKSSLFPGTRVTEEPNLFRRETFAHPQRDRHGWDELIGCAEGPVGEGKDGVGIVLLNTDSGTAK